MFYYRIKYQVRISIYSIHIPSIYVFECDILARMARKLTMFKYGQSINVLYTLFTLLCFSLYCLHVNPVFFTNSQPISQLHRRSISVVYNVPCVSTKKSSSSSASLAIPFFCF